MIIIKNNDICRVIELLTGDSIIIKCSAESDIVRSILIAQLSVANYLDHYDICAINLVDCVEHIKNLVERLDKLDDQDGSDALLIRYFLTMIIELAIESSDVQFLQELLTVCAGKFFMNGVMVKSDSDVSYSMAPLIHRVVMQKFSDGSVMLQQLLHHHPDINACYEGHNILSHAISLNKHVIATDLIDQFPHLMTSEQSAPLMQAILLKHAAHVVRMLKKGASLAVKSDGKEPADLLLSPEYMSFRQVIIKNLFDINTEVHDAACVDAIKLLGSGFHLTELAWFANWLPKEKEEEYGVKNIFYRQYARLVAGSDLPWAEEIDLFMQRENAEDLQNTLIDTIAALKLIKTTDELIRTANSAISLFALIKKAVTDSVEFLNKIDKTQELQGFAATHRSMWLSDQISMMRELAYSVCTQLTKQINRFKSLNPKLLASEQSVIANLIQISAQFKHEVVPVMPLYLEAVISAGFSASEQVKKRLPDQCKTLSEEFDRHYKALVQCADKIQKQNKPAAPAAAKQAKSMTQSQRMKEFKKWYEAGKYQKALEHANEITDAAIRSKHEFKECLAMTYYRLDDLNMAYEFLSALHDEASFPSSKKTRIRPLLLDVYLKKNDYQSAFQLHQQMYPALTGYAELKKRVAILSGLNLLDEIRLAYEAWLSDHVDDQVAAEDYLQFLQEHHITADYLTICKAQMILSNQAIAVDQLQHVAELDIELTPEIAQMFAYLTPAAQCVYLVGSAARDLLLGTHSSNDYDFVCANLNNAELSKKGFRACQHELGSGHHLFTFTGKIPGVVTKISIDLALKPKAAGIDERQWLHADSMHRDATANSIYVGSTGHVYDFHHGLFHASMKKYVEIPVDGPDLNANPALILRAFYYASAKGYVLSERFVAAIRDFVGVTAEQQERVNVLFSQHMKMLTPEQKKQYDKLMREYDIYNKFEAKCSLVKK